MKYRLRWATAIIITLLALIFMFPLNEKIRLGLDLQGGMHVVLGVKTEKAVEGKVETLAGQLKKELKGEKIKYSYVQRTLGNKINMGFSNPQDVEKVRDLIKKNYPYLVEA